MNKSVSEFEVLYPEYIFNFSQALAGQTRIYEPDALSLLPKELSSSFEYRSGGRGRPNRNQTRTHSQCATCHRVLRNDYFYTPPSLIRRNVVYSHCKSCAQHINEVQYQSSSSAIRSDYLNVWTYLTSQCTHCGFNQHVSALDLHHIDGETGETLVSNLLAEFIHSQSPHKGEKLLKQIEKCIPLCCNCHRMLHAGAIDLPSTSLRPHYRLDDLMKFLRK